MKQIFTILAGTLLLALLVISCGNNTAASISLDSYSSTELPNEMKLHSFPTADRFGDLMSITFRLQTSALQETRDEAGFSSLATRLLALPVADQRKQALMFYVENQPDALYFSIEFLKEDLDIAVDFCMGKLAFDIELTAFDSVKNSLISELSGLANTKTQEMSDRINQLLYAETGLAHSNQDKLNALNAADYDSFKKFIERTVRPEFTQVSIAGSLDRSLLNNFIAPLSSWHVTSETSLVEQKTEPKMHEGTFSLLNADSAMARIYILRNIPNPPAEDYYALKAVNFILNGARVGIRLAEIDQQGGRPDTVESLMNLQNNASTNVIVANSPAANALQMLTAIRRELEVLMRGTLNQQRFLDQEILDSKNYLGNQLIRRVQSPRQLSHFLLWSYNHGFIDPSPEAHLKIIETLDQRKLDAAVDTYFNREILVNALLVVGPEDVLEPQFKDWNSGEAVSQASTVN